MQLPPDIQLVFFETLEGYMPIPAFETWLYANQQLESLLPPDDYFELIAYNYKSPNPKRGLNALLLAVIDMAAYETWRVRHKLVRALLHDETLPELLMSLYTMYIKGYFFLEHLALQFGLEFDIEYSGYWKDMSLAQQQQELEQMYPLLDRALHEAIGWLDDQRIVFSGQRDRYGYPVYEDHR